MIYEILICFLVELSVINEDEIIKNEKNLDKVVRVHTHDLMKIGFYLKVSYVEYL